MKLFIAIYEFGKNFCSFIGLYCLIYFVLDNIVRWRLSDLGYIQKIDAVLITSLDYPNRVPGSFTDRIIMAFGYQLGNYVIFIISIIPLIFLIWFLVKNYTGGDNESNLQ